MTLSGFKRYIRERLMVLKINAINSYQIETAYFANNWGNLISTVAFTLTYILLINIIFSNIPSFAGYSRNEVLLLMVITQINFYSIFTWSVENLRTMIVDVNRGNLDLVLTKPLPTLFYVTFKDLRLVTMFRDGAIPLIFVIAAVNWSDIVISPINLLASILVFIFGQIASDTFLFMLAVPVFWKGESQEVFSMSYAFYGREMPFEGYPRSLKIIFTTLIPLIISTALTCSVLLGKSDTLITTIYAAIIGITCLMIKSYVWKIALKNYTSASS